jgi:bacteriorhodopsin
MLPAQITTPQFGDLTYWTLWVTTVLMAAGGTLLVSKSRGFVGEAREHAVASVFVPFVAAAMYLAMALGYGVTDIQLLGGDEQLVFWARYADWLVTTPLLLFDLALFAGADRETIATLVGLDVYMIVTGAIGAFSKAPTERYIWWLVSTGAFLGVLYVVFARLGADASARGVASEFSTLRNLLVGLWCVYPVLWLVGPEGLGVVPLGVETVVYAALDLTAKVGFGYLLLRSTDALDASSARQSTGAAPTGDD